MQGWDPASIAAMFTAATALVAAVGGVVTAWRAHGKANQALNAPAQEQPAQGGTQPHQAP